MKCKKLIYKGTNDLDEEVPFCLIGIIVNEDQQFITFKTARKEYRISKNVVNRIEDTDIDFKTAGDGDD